MLNADAPTRQEIIASLPPALQQLCNDYPEVAEDVRAEADKALQRARQQIDGENPFAEERALLREFQEAVTPQTFHDRWPPATDYLHQVYSATEFNTAFYTKKFEQALAAKKQRLRSFMTVKNHFTDRWKTLVHRKQQEYEANVISAEMEACRADLAQKVADLQQLKELLGPLESQLGKLWGGRVPVTRKYSGFDVLRSFAKLLARDESLKKIVELLGRIQKPEFEEEAYFDTISRGVWKTEEASSKADLVGIKESNDLSSLLPSETALLSEAALEPVFLKKFAESKLQTFDYRSRVLVQEHERVRKTRQKEIPKGPFILCVDTSGSMAMGERVPEIIAKTLCFALVRMALLEQRKCYLINFSTQIETLDLSDMRTSLEKLLGFLLMSFEGGTDVEPALEHALRMLETQEFSKADVLIISDFILGELSYDLRMKIKAAQARKTQFHSLIVWERDSSLGGGGRNKEFINALDNSWVYNPHNPVEVLQKISKR